MTMDRDLNILRHDAPPPPRKRLRKIWSCLECRRRRLHCDRVTPVCGRCKKSEKSEKCQYLHTEESSTTPGETSETKKAGEEVAGGRSSTTSNTASRQGQSSISFDGIAKGLDEDGMSSRAMIPEHFFLGSSVPGISSAALATPESMQCLPPLASRQQDIRDPHATTSVGSMAEAMAGLQDFTKEAFRRYSVMNQLRLAMHKIETESYESHRTQYFPGVAGLTSFLTSKDEAECLVHLYFSRLHGVYDLLDPPAFKARLEGIMSGEAAAEGYSTIVVLLVIAIAMCLQSTSTFAAADDGVSYRDGATSIITACRLYVEQNPSRRHTLQELQAQFLLLWDEQLNARRFKQTFANAGKLVRTFMSAGLHRNGSIVRSRRLSDPEILLRRKIWMAAVELELQAAFEQGMPPASLHSQNDSQATQYFNDRINEEQRCSAGSSSTPSTLSILQKSFRARHQLCLRLNSSTASLPFVELKEAAEALGAELESAGGAELGSDKVRNVVASLTIRQYLLALHLRQLQCSASSLESTLHQSAIIQHATMIIETGYSFCRAGDPILDFLAGHQIRAALCIASVCLTGTASADRLVVSFVRNEARNLLDKAIDMIQFRVTHFTGDQRQLWTAIAAQTLVKLQTGAVSKEDALRAAVEKYVEAFAGMGLLDDSQVLHTNESGNSAALVQSPGAASSMGSWALEDWFDMDFVDFGAGLQ